jgi:hypothetical protein
MKKLIIAYLMILSLSTGIAIAGNPENNTSDKSKDKKENKLSDEEANRLTNRVTEIRNMDKSKMSAKEKRETRKELRTIKKKDGTVLYISGGTLLVIILILLLI